MADARLAAPIDDLLGDVFPIPGVGCWLWAGAWDSSKYGKKYVRANVKAGAHRVVYLQFVGPIPNGMYVLHRCDTPPCVNPGHLFLGTALDNMRDKTAKGRGWAGPTRVHPDIAQIIRDNPGESQLSLSFRLGVPREAVSRIRKKALAAQSRNEASGGE